jgi:hypothetical protein
MNTEEFNIHKWQAKYLRKKINEEDIPVAGGGDYYFKSDDIDQEKEFVLMRTDILATIDELNQYLNGNVTKDSLVETLTDLAFKINKL